MTTLNQLHELVISDKNSCPCIKNRHRDIRVFFLFVCLFVCFFFWFFVFVLFLFFVFCFVFLFLFVCLFVF